MANYTQLSCSERYKLNARLKQSVKEIAKELNRNRSTIYRELKRNKENDSYDAAIADHLAKNRRSGGAKSCFETNIELKEYVLEGLNKGWSPEQISGRMKQERRSFSACPETIYQFIYRDPSKKLYELLPTKRKKRTHRHHRKKYNNAIKAAIIEAHNIKHRPIEVNARSSVGHWEGDTIRFTKDQKNNVTTLVERMSRFTIMLKNADGKTKTVIDPICKIIKKTKKNLWKSITFDQGVEFMDFPKIKRLTSCQTFLCDPRSPWQRPTNENTNGRIRRFLPKDFPVDTISNLDLEVICDRMNNTPRKCLGYQTPKEIFNIQGMCRTSP